MFDLQGMGDGGRLVVGERAEALGLVGGDSRALPYKVRPWDLGLRDHPGGCWYRLRNDGLGGIEVLLHQQGREREGVADVVEAMPRIVRRELGLRVVVHA